MGAGWCPPGMLGIGVGGTAEKAMLLAKESLLDPIDMHELKARGPKNRLEELRIDIHDQVNALGIGAQGLGGLTTVLDVKIRDLPHPRGVAAGGGHPQLRGDSPRALHARRHGPGRAARARSGRLARRRVGAGARRPTRRPRTLTRERVQTGKPARRLLLSGKMLTGRDAAHKRIADLLASGEPLPPGLDFTNRFIYYVGPVDPVRGEVVGPAGPTTATRMDKFTDMMLAKTGLLGMIGKAERGPAAIESIKAHKAVYLIAVGGAAYLVSRAIKARASSRFRTSAWKRSASSRSRTCPSRWPSIRRGTRSTRRGPPSGERRILRSNAI